MVVPLPGSPEMGVQGPAGAQVRICDGAVPSFARTSSWPVLDQPRSRAPSEVPAWVEVMSGVRVLVMKSYTCNS